MAKRKSHEEFVREVYERHGDDIEIIGRYNGYKIPVLVRHKCGNIYETSSKNITSGLKGGSLGCNKCRRSNKGGIKWSNETFLLKAKEELGEEFERYEFLDKYKNSSTKIRAFHKDCGNIWEFLPPVLLRHSRCLHCSGVVQKSNKQFLEEVSGLVGSQYTFLEPYKNAKTKLRIRHNNVDCGNNVFYVSPNDFLSSGARCNSKKHKIVQKNQKTTEEFKEEVIFKVGDEYSVVGDYVNAHTKIDIVHNKCGFLWSTTPRNFLNGNRCGKCNKPPFVFEDFILDAKKMYGDEYTPMKYTMEDGMVEITHTLCKKTYKISPSLFRRGVRCGSCHGGVKLTNEQFLSRLKDRRGDEFIPLEEYDRAITKMRFTHSKCARDFISTPNAILSGNGCPLCSQSRGEDKVADVLGNFGLNYIAQYTNRKCRYKYVLPFDFAVIDDNKVVLLLIEYDGEHHFEPGHFKNTEDDFKKIVLRDEIKDEFCLSNDIPLLRIPYWEFENIEHIIFDKLVDLNILEEAF